MTQITSPRSTPMIADVQANRARAEWLAQQVAETTCADAVAGLDAADE